jgi:hypothetical protein
VRINSPPTMTFLEFAVNQNYELRVIFGKLHKDQERR